MTSNNKPRKLIADMTREELIEFQGAITLQLRESNMALDTARRRARAAGEFLHPDELHAMEHRRATLANLLGKIAAQMGKLRTQRRSVTTWEARFVAAARELMDPGFFELVKERAAEMQGEGGGDDRGA